MADKKYFFNYDDLIKAIALAFGSIENNASHKKTSRENIYQKTGRQSGKYIAELVKDGVDLSNIMPSNLDSSHQKVSQQFNDNKIINEAGGRGNGLIESLLEQIKDFRRTFGMEMARTVRPLKLKQLMRHQDIRTTMKYYVDEQQL